MKRIIIKIKIKIKKIKIIKIITMKYIEKKFFDYRAKSKRKVIYFRTAEHVYVRLCM
jgi:hypothetical protein